MPPVGAFSAQLPWTAVIGPDQERTDADVVLSLKYYY